jgi:hypothetical protein
MILRGFSCLTICREPWHLKLIVPRHLNKIVATASVPLHGFVKNAQPLQVIKTCHILPTKLGQPNTTIPRRFSSDGNDPVKREHFENVLTIPNILTVSRMVICPFLGHLVGFHSFLYYQHTLNLKNLGCPEQLFTSFWSVHCGRNHRFGKIDFSNLLC